MFITIVDPEYKYIPKLIFRGKSHSGIIKKSQLRIYSDARALLIYLEEEIEKMQVALEKKASQLFSEKEDELSSYINKLKEEAKNELYNNAEKSLSDFIYEQTKKFEKIASEMSCTLKEKIEKSIRERLENLWQSEAFINHLIDILHHEIGDVEKTLTVKKYNDERGVTLYIENDDGIISFCTEELISELKKTIKNCFYD